MQEAEKSIYSWSRSIFLRDLDITKKGFVYFLVAFIFYFISIILVITSFIDFLPYGIEISTMPSLVFFISIVVSLVFSGFIVDKFKNRMKLLLYCSIAEIVGLILFVFTGTLLEIIGLSIIVFFSGVLVIDLLTIVTHESTILNRGRLLGYLFCLSGLIGAIIVLLSMQNIIVILVIESVILYGLYYISKQYNYTETEKRLKSSLKFREVFKSKNNPAFGYMTSFIVLGFVLGTAFPFDVEIIIDPTTFVGVALIFLVIYGVLLDKMGRKWSYVAGILVLSFLIIFSAIFRDLYNAVFFGIALPVVIVSVCTFAGDFSTERNTLKYRGRITAIFIFSIVGGVVAGVGIKYLLTQLFDADQTLYYWIPSVINGINSLLLIILLVWIMPLPEILSAKEATWANKIRNLYVFNRDSICLYNKNFLSDAESDALDLPPEDLITGGLTGILTLISEITSEKKNLRIIDKDRIKIYFAYGKSIIITLISTEFLPILFKKLEVFSKAFEREFEEELANFRGKINPFLKRGDHLVRRYFKT